MPCDVLCVVLIIESHSLIHNIAQHCNHHCGWSCGCCWDLRISCFTVHELAYYNKCGFYRDFHIAVSRSVQWVLKTVALLMFIALVAAHCDSKGSFKGRYEQL